MGAPGQPSWVCGCDYSIIHSSDLSARPQTRLTHVFSVIVLGPWRFACLSHLHRPSRHGHGRMLGGTHSDFTFHLSPFSFSFLSCLCLCLSLFYVFFFKGQCGKTAKAMHCPQQHITVNTMHLKL